MSSESATPSPTIQEQIDADWKAAMKARAPEKNALASIRTELKNRAIEVRSAGDQTTTVSDEDANKVLVKMAKQRSESIAEYTKGGRDDLVEKEAAELKVIEGYLPAGLGEDAVLAIVDEVIAATGATSMSDLGKVMGQAMAKAKAAGRVDGKVVQAAVKTRLGG